jgi:sedoheptulokinase
VTWEDGRGDELLSQGKTVIQIMTERTGGARKLATGYGVVTLFHWLNTGPPRGLARVCGIVDYVILALTGAEEPTTDYTMAETMGMFDPFQGTWDTGLLRDLGVPQTMLPLVLPPTRVAGMVALDWLRDLGNNRDIPVCSTLGDNQAGYLASAGDPDRAVLINIGTGSQISVAVPRETALELQGRVDGLDVTLRPFVDDGFLVAGSALAGGVAYRKLHDFYATVARELFGVSESKDLYSRMEETARLAGDTGGLTVHPALGGSRSRPHERGAVEGLSFGNLTPGHLSYAMLEGILKTLRGMMGQHLLEGRDQFVGSGNGLRKNRLMREIAEDVFGHPLLIPRIPEEAAVGAAMNGAVAAGVFRDFTEARELIQYQD